MSFDIHVAVHAADWPTPAALNRCMEELRYPVRLGGLAAGAMSAHLKETNGTMTTRLNGERVQLEASAARIGPDKPYAFRMRDDVQPAIPPDEEGSFAVYEVKPENFQPADLNTDLKSLGVPSPNFRDGDYVVTVSFRGSRTELRAGSYLLAGFIRCARGIGFERQAGTWGRDDFAASLIAGANHPVTRELAD